MAPANEQRLNEAKLFQQEAYADFLSHYPSYAQTAILDEVRRTDYGRLDQHDHVYLDYTGGSLYAVSQLSEHMALLQESIFGNPHSHNPSSMAMTRLVDRTREAVLDFFNADPQQYVVVFTANASGALKLVAESYPFTADGRFALSADDHNSVNGIREFARARGAKVLYAPITRNELRLDQDRLQEVLETADPLVDNLFAFPAQSNYSGVKHPLTIIEAARERGWDVLLDCAAFAPTNRLDLGRWQPDFATFSFYKMFGYPTGIGALLVRRAVLGKLRRPWFAGGTIKIVSVNAFGHFLAEDEAAFEDGTINYLNIPAVEIGLRHLNRLGMATITERVRCLTGWVLDRLAASKHSSGRPIVKIHGPNNLEMRGGTITMSFFDGDGQPISGQIIEQLAAQANISLRTGCFCNPGSGETTFDLPADLMETFFKSTQGLYFQELVAVISESRGIDISAVRISIGLASNFDDVYRFVKFVDAFQDRAAASFARTPEPRRRAMRDTA